MDTNVHDNIFSASFSYLLFPSFIVLDATTGLSNPIYNFFIYQSYSF